MDNATTTPAGAPLIPEHRTVEIALRQSVIASTTNPSSLCPRGFQHTRSVNTGVHDVAKRGLWQIHCGGSTGNGCPGPLTRGEEYSAVDESLRAARAENMYVTSSSEGAQTFLH
jgi:hypothetical protein